MNEHKLHQILAGLPSVVRKMYEFAPIAEPLSLRSIHAAAMLKGVGLSVASTEFRLNSLVDAGVVKKAGDCYIREKVVKTRVKPQGEVEVKEAQATATVSVAQIPAKEKTFADTIMVLSDRCEKMVNSIRQLAHDVKQLSEDIAMVAIEADQKMSSDAADAQKLRTLQAMLKGL